MTYASTSVDRRAIYYARAAEIIAADPLDFYTRAERGRKFQTSQLNNRFTRAEEIVSRYLGSVGQANATRSQVVKAPLREPRFLHC